jgi:hypothetical protein
MAPSAGLTANNRALEWTYLILLTCSSWLLIHRTRVCDGSVSWTYCKYPKSCTGKGVGPSTTFAWPSWKQPDIPVEVDTTLGCPRNEKKISVRTEKNRNMICFAFVSVCFVKPQKIVFGLFWCFEPISKQPKQAELFRIEPKQ